MTEPQDQDRGEALHLVRLTLNEPELRHLGRCRGLTCGPEDLDYLIHALLAEVWPGEMKPFAVMDWQRTEQPRVCVLGLARRPAGALVEEAQQLAEPDAWRCLALAGLEGPSSKPITQFAEGLRLGFRVRVCPVTRGGHGEGDVFAARCHEAGEAPVDREAVYREWLIAQVDKSGGARVRSAEVAGFRLRSLYRRRHVGAERVPVRARLPDVTLRGVLEVTDARAFRALYARGVGRHRAFGFGMLLLSRAAEE